MSILIDRIFRFLIYFIIFVFFITLFFALSERVYHRNFYIIMILRMNLYWLFYIGLWGSVQCVIVPTPKLSDLREIFGGGPIELFEVATGPDLDFLSNQCLALLVSVSCKF